ncbi:hypothetical protein CQW23_27673 [Capsicum baccatum]|uniref:Uncharacterized protein n=1 Tax=Capsicum baccatum TaxID=33114 RepID=A0A2G2VEE8_CAPBA|nr:hypothetical protein CQW23_27673 [Capsicum baccatum]
MENVNVEKGSSVQQGAHNVYTIDKKFVFEIGMKFDSKEKSYNAYNSYAVAKGFGVRKERKRQRLEYRCRCLARIKFKISNDMWEVCEFNDVHSHPMIVDNLRHFIQSGRKLTSSTKNILGSMVEAGIRTKKMVRYLQKEADGIENTGFIEQDAHNFIQAHKRNIISGGDAQTLINHFMHLQSEDSNFFYSFQVDEDGRLCNFFWRDSFLEYTMSVLGIISEENGRKNTYNNFIDQAPAIAIAVREVFPEKCHRLCEWHIDRNAQKNIPHLYWKQGFRNYFDTLLWRCKSESEFEVRWQNMISDWDCANNTWLQKLWTKNAKHDSECEEYTKKKETMKSSMASRLNGLMKESFAVMTLVANDLDSEEIVRKYLYHAKIEIIKHQSELYAENHEKDKNKFNRTDSVTGCKDQVLDPIKKKRQGKWIWKNEVKR